MREGSDDRVPGGGEEDMCSIKVENGLTLLHPSVSAAVLL